MTVSKELMSKIINRNKHLNIDYSQYIKTHYVEKDIKFIYKNKITGGITGTELKKILDKLGMGPYYCKCCQGFEIEMNNWGNEDCKKNIDLIVKRLYTNLQIKNLKGFLRAIKIILKVAYKSIITGLIFKIGIFRPVRGMVLLSIKRSELQNTR
jgi:hypothetical protein